MTCNKGGMEGGREGGREGESVEQGKGERERCAGVRRCSAGILLSIVELTN